MRRFTQSLTATLSSIAPQRLAPPRLATPHLSTQRRIALFLSAVLPAVALCSFPVHAADENAIRASTSEVRIAFAVSDREGHRVQSLRSSDVAVADNGSII